MEKEIETIVSQLPKPKKPKKKIEPQKVIHI